jgi:hypothetical protein
MIDAQHWLPIFSQDVEAYVSIKINIRMINLGNVDIVSTARPAEDAAERNKIIL